MFENVLYSCIAIIVTSSNVTFFLNFFYDVKQCITVKIVIVWAEELFNKYWFAVIHIFISLSIVI